jgi:ubiquinone/menaquinone biosynthesis C-methylase UbiE
LPHGNLPSLHGASEAAPRTQGRTIRWARRYDLFLFTLGQARRLRSRTADLARLLPGEAVLDVGYGTGDLKLEVVRRVGSSGLVVGMDATPEMVARSPEGQTPRHGD